MKNVAAMSVVTMLMLAVMSASGLLEPRALRWIAAAALPQIAGYLYIAYGVVSMAHDRRLVGLQTLGAAMILLAAAFGSTTPEARAIPLLLLPLTFSFASLRYGRQALLRLAGLLLALVLLEQVTTLAWRPGMTTITGALLQTAALAVSLVTIALVAGHTNDWRRGMQFERAMAQTALSKMHEAVVAFDLDRRIRFLNAGAARLFGVAPHRALGRTIDALFRPDDAAPADHPRDRASAGAVAYTIRASDGQRREVELSTLDLARPGRASIGQVLIARDIGRTNQLIRELVHNSTHDGLTGLLNRRGFMEALREAAAAGAERCLLVLDLDQFKVVNDACGHQAGDQLLCDVAAILLARFPRADAVARIGGDEFAIVLPGAEGACEPMAQALLATLRDYRFVRDGKPFRVQVSIGLAVQAAPIDAEGWLAQADAACYLAKRLGRARVQVYRSGDEAMMRHHEEVGWVSRLQDAIERDRLVLYAQRIVATTADGRAEGGHFEVLLRLRGEDGQVVPPGAFLPAAERFGLMPAIDRWVVREAIDMLGRWPGGPARRPELAINLSASSLRDEGLVEFVARRLSGAGVPGDRITFELTESAALLDLQRAREFVAQLRSLGCRVALDDVGAGFSSFSHLRLLPIDLIKIDGSFVRSVCEQPLDRVLVESLQRIAGALGARTVAEFVETEAVARVLREIGVDYLQGYALHRPEPIDEIQARLAPARPAPARAPVTAGRDG